MFFGRKKRHKLPRFPEGVGKAFRSFCEALPVEDLPQLRVELEDCIAQTYALADENPLLDRELIDDLYRCCVFLLDNYEGYSSAQRALAIGAIRYFVTVDDPLPDDGFSSGFFDDAQVMNYALEQIGEENMFIKIS